jgi:hypothetical protein
MKHPSARVLLLLSWVATSACGSKYGLVVPQDMLSRLPYETRVELLESENELAVSLDKLDEAKNEILRTRDSLRRAKSRKSAAEDEESRAKDAQGKEVARLAIAEAEARVEYLRAKQSVNLGQEELEELAVRCAYARFDQSRLQILRKNKVAGSEKLNPEDFAKQADACQKELAGRQKEMQGDVKRAETTLASWETAKGQLAKKTFDARSSPYVE